MYCQNDDKGKVIFKSYGVTKTIEVEKTPFTISCNPVGVCGKTGTRKITYNVSNPAAASNNGSEYSFSSFKDEIVFFKAVPQAGTYDGNRYDLWASCPDGERLVEASFSVSSGSVTITNNVFTADGGTGLTVKDASGNILYNIKVDECDFEISCDDDCPEGSHKCTHNKYPGYCCVPCKEVGDRLKNMANKVGR